MKKNKKLPRIFLVGICIFAFIVVFVTLSSSPEMAKAAEQDRFFGLINCVHVTGCQDIGFRCIVEGSECSYYPTWCPECGP